MEFIEGRTLSEIIKNEVGPIEQDRAINLFKQMLEGIAYIHSQPKPIIHRDIKPLNILVTSDDTVKITDFGIAKELEDADGGHSTTVKGTPVYMSPEQILRPSTVDIRTDVYSLGVTFYEMLCAKSPFHGKDTTTPTAVYAALMDGDVPPPTKFYHAITKELSAFVMKAMHKDRNERFASANEMLQELERLERSGQTTVIDTKPSKPPIVIKPIPEKPINTSEVPTRYDWFPTKKRRNMGIFAGSFAVILIIIFGIWASRKIPPKNTEPSNDSESVAQGSSTLTPEQQKEMVLVEGGTFTMGATSEQGSEAQSDEKPAHEVTVSSFYMAKYEITRELWESVIGSNPSSFKGAKRPEENVSWYDVVEFCNKLSEKEGLTPAYTIDKENKDPNNESKYDEKKWTATCNFKANGYRLPTEAEWEYAARGGNKSKGYKYSGSNNLDEVGWNSSNSGSETHEVGQKQPNELGLYDMSGNVWELCWDWYGDYNSGSQTNPTGPSVGSYRGLRGGSWGDDSELCRVAGRNFNDPFSRYGSSGFRLLRTIL